MSSLQRHVVRQALIKVVEIDTPLKVSDVAVASTYCSVSVVLQQGVNPITGQSGKISWLEINSSNAPNASIAIDEKSSIIDGIELGQENILFLKSKPNERWRAFGFQGRGMTLEWMEVLRAARRSELESLLSPPQSGRSPPASARAAAAPQSQPNLSMSKMPLDQWNSDTSTHQPPSQISMPSSGMMPRTTGSLNPTSGASGNLASGDIPQTRPAGVSALNLSNVRNKMYDSNQTLPLSSPQTLDRKRHLAGSNGLGQQHGSSGTIDMDNPLGTNVSQGPLESVATDFFPNSPRPGQTMPPAHLMPQTSSSSNNATNSNNPTPRSEHKQIWKNEKEAFRAAERLKIDITQRITQSERDMMLRKDGQEGVYDGGALNHAAYGFHSPSMAGGAPAASMPEISQLQSLAGIREVDEKETILHNQKKHDPTNPSTVISHIGIPHDLPTVQKLQPVKEEPSVSPTHLEEELDQKRIELDKQRNEFVDLKVAYNKSLEEIRSITKKYEMEQRHSRSLEIEVKRQASELQQLKQELQQAQQNLATTDSSAAKQENEMLRQEHQKILTDMNSIQKESRNLKSENEFCLSELENAKDVLIKMDNERNSACKERDSLRRDIENCRAEYEFLKKERDTALQTRDNALQNSLKEKESRYLGLQTERDMLVKEKAQLKSERDVFQEQYVQARHDLDQIQAMFTECEGKLKHTDKKLVQRNKQYRELSDEKKSVLTTIDALVQMFVKLNSKWDSDFITSMGNGEQQEELMKNASEDRKRMCQAMANEAMFLGRAIHEQVSNSKTESPSISPVSSPTEPPRSKETTNNTNFNISEKLSDVKNRLNAIDERAIMSESHHGSQHGSQGGHGSQHGSVSGSNYNSRQGTPNVQPRDRSVSPHVQSYYINGRPITPGGVRPSLGYSPIVQAWSPGRVGIPPLVPNSQQQQQQQVTQQVTQSGQVQGGNQQVMPHNQQQLGEIQKHPEHVVIPHVSINAKPKPIPYSQEGHVDPTKVNLNREESVAEILQRFQSPGGNCRIAPNVNGYVAAAVAHSGATNLMSNVNTIPSVPARIISSHSSPMPGVTNSPRLKTQLVVFPPEPYYVNGVARTVSTGGASVGVGSVGAVSGGAASVGSQPRENEFQTPNLDGGGLFQTPCMHYQTPQMTPQMTPQQTPLVSGDRQATPQRPMNHAVVIPGGNQGGFMNPVNPNLSKTGGPYRSASIPNNTNSMTAQTKFLAGNAVATMNSNLNRISQRLRVGFPSQSFGPDPPYHSTPQHANGIINPSPSIGAGSVMRGASVPGWPNNREMAWHPS